MLLKVSLLFFLVAVGHTSAESKHWALLIAGSNTYDNYRHQADICHAYHIMRKHGIPEENIVTMMYDDIAYNQANPVKGNIINRPVGPNVYPGVVIDYRHENVNPDVFLAVLRGDQDAVYNLTGNYGKVIKSGPEDHVFVNFADHGGPDILGFPDSVLYAHQLESTVKFMHSKNKYKKMVFYVEACFSGSIFKGLLPKDISVFAETAANANESSYACYYDEKRETYLGDLFSVNWMQDSDKENLKTETIQKQFLIARRETNTSHVKEYGDLSISKMTVAEFQGDQSVDSMPARFPNPAKDAVPASEADLTVLRYRLRRARTPEERRQFTQKIRDLLVHRSEITYLFRDIVETLKRIVRSEHQVVMMEIGDELSYTNLMKERRTLTKTQCYENAVNTLMKSCPKMRLSQNYHALGQLYVLLNMCERKYYSQHISTAVHTAASHRWGLCSKL